MTCCKWILYWKNNLKEKRKLSLIDHDNTFDSTSDIFLYFYLCTSISLFVAHVKI